MNRSELIEQLSELHPKLQQRMVKKIVHKLFDHLSSSLLTGKRVEIRKFGSFSLRYRPKGMIKNPRDNIFVFSEARYLVSFKSSRLLNERITRKKYGGMDGVIVGDSKE